MSRRRVVRGWALWGLWVCGACGCVAPGTDFEALPFYREDRTTPGLVSYDVPPLLSTRDVAELTEEEEAQGGGAAIDQGTAETKEEDELVVMQLVWPLGRYTKHRNRSALTFQGVLPSTGNAGPLGRAISSDPGVRQDLIANFATDPVAGGTALLPLYFYDIELDHNAIPDVGSEPDLDQDTGFLPFFAYGTGPNKEDNYFAAFPFGGTTKGLIGKDEMIWYGFPYPFYLEINDEHYDSRHVLFPFVNWVEGPRNSGWRIWPFYGHYERTTDAGEPVYDRTFVLWPFLTWSHDGLNEEEPTDVFFAMPFYGSIRGPELDSTSVLWPFFKYEEDKRRKRWDLRAPFPFFQIGGSDEDAADPSYWKFDLWPLFGIKEREGFHRHFALWPIWRREELDSKDRAFRGTWALPLFWTTYWEHKDEGTEERRVRLFPLLHYRSLRSGEVEFAMLSPWYFDDPNGFERVLSPWLRLYRYHRDADGGFEHQALWGAFSYRERPAWGGRAEYLRWSLLFGMIHYRNLGGEKGLRILWGPEITWGEADA